MSFFERHMKFYQDMVHARIRFTHIFLEGGRQAKKFMTGERRL